MTKRIKLAATALLTWLCYACGSVGTAQKPVDPKPPKFVDAKTSAQVEPVLIIPKYSTATGVSTGAGHGPGRMVDDQFLASPFIYRAGSAFEPKMPDSRGLSLGPVLFVGRGMALNGVIVISQNHTALWWWDLWARDLQPLKLEPIVEASSYRQRLLSLLEREEVRGRELTDEELSTFDLITEFDLKVAFSSDDRRKVRAFLTAGS
jgi:hypothetical protein